MEKNNICFFSHRGNNHHNYKENTKKALLSSLEKDYISGIEFDIRLTKDKKIVVFHNRAILINNEKQFIENLTLLELRKFKINTLDEILKEIKTNKILLIEIKYEGKEYKKTVDIILKQLADYQYLNIYLCSFHYKMMKYCKSRSNFKCGLIIGDFMSFFRILNDLDFNSIHYDLIKKIPKKETFIWTVNNENALNKIIKYNKNRTINIITDNSYLFNESRQPHSHFLQ